VAGVTKRQIKVAPPSTHPALKRYTRRDVPLPNALQEALQLRNNTFDLFLGLFKDPPSSSPVENEIFGYIAKLLLG